ncbi:MAG: phage integrase N-terminal SAM-like domain-containing protein [Rhodoferax sp.]|uniref:phage integrase N-terminal SAM-like domain-containing protein n=1 Tax=Rhodoferax sp. TaxID=50421 RepID=UPI00273738E6|nr:phage integrase N-terminal SAM-like domain-containing protein [Rhodoferax sp.]MDP2678809.1 phage integrase N-terminal SAM-like domain-containing protein [Rhodoferax sp.]
MRLVYKTDGLIEGHRRVEVGDRQVDENHLGHSGFSNRFEGNNLVRCLLLDEWRIAISTCTETILSFGRRTVSATLSPIPQSKHLLNQVREVLRCKHYSLKTEQAYLYWVRCFLRWHGRNGQTQHPSNPGASSFHRSPRQGLHCGGAG